MVDETEEKRYCGSCPRAYHSDDGSLRCEWLWNINLKKKCPWESELSYKNRLIKREICPNCKDKLEWYDFILGYCRKCTNEINFNLMET